MLPQVSKYLAIAGIQETQVASAKDMGLLSLCQHPPRPVQQRMRITLLRLDIDGFISIKGPYQYRQGQALGIRARKAPIAIRAPLHRGTDTIPIAKMDVVTHADLVAVIKHGRSRHGQEQAIHQFNAPAVTLEQGREPPPYSQVDAGAPIGGVHIPQIVAFAAGYHLERQLVMVAQKYRPLTVLRDFRGLLHDVGNREAVRASDGHIHARHERKVE